VNLRRATLVNYKAITRYLGTLLGIFALVLIAPLVVALLYRENMQSTRALWAFAIPAGVCLAASILVRRRFSLRALSVKEAMLVCALAWILVSAVGAVPFVLSLGVGPLDAFFESVSGFTTTGITVFTNLDDMPKSILFWRSLMQWLGGLGILTFFLAVMTETGAAHQLFGAESHKIFSKRPAPGIFSTLKILWLIYGGFTVAVGVAMHLAGMSPFDAVCHALTTLSTGGFSPHDQSIDFYRNAQYAGYVAIEYITTFGMLLGGISFVLHYRVIRGKFKALWDSTEIRTWWLILGAFTAVVMLDHFRTFGFGEIESTFRYSVFQVASLATTTGFASKDINAPWFPAAAKQLFLVLMIIGGCVGSTAGGFKVLRIAILGKAVKRQILRIIRPARTVNPLVLDGTALPVAELRRVAALFFAWMAMLVAGGVITALFTNLSPWASFSGMFSALGNIGPCYISVAEMAAIHPVVKVTYIIGMLAGRLELLPILVLFVPSAWK